MSFEYRYTSKEGDLLTIMPSISRDRVFISVTEHNGYPAMHIAKADVPTVAAELLKAAGRAELAGMIEAVEADRSARAEREAAEKKLQERRDAVARRFENFRHLVDAYLTLEDELDGASRD